MRTRTFHAREPDALVLEVTVLPGEIYMSDCCALRIDIRGNNYGRLWVKNESDALALASRLLGWDVTGDT